MTVNTYIYINNDVEAEDIVQAIGFLLGAKKWQEPLSSGSLATWYDVEEINVEPNKKAKYVYVQSTHNIQYHLIMIAPTTIDENWHQGSLFTYPDQRHLGYYIISGGCNPFWKQIGRALVDMFGGFVDDNDSDITDIDYFAHRPRACNCPQDGKEWQDYQQALFDMPVLAQFI